MSLGVLQPMREHKFAKPAQARALGAADEKMCIELNLSDRLVALCAAHWFKWTFGLVAKLLD
jgi:hypothetical protein